MTEDEAKTKWCPAVRYVLGTGGDHAFDNRGDALDPMRVPCCIGSACMAWRGRETADFKSQADAAFRLRGVTMKPLPKDIEGYCGLAGASA